MALNIKDRETEELAAEVAQMAGENKTAAVRQALRERRDRLELVSGGGSAAGDDLLSFLETEVWPQLPAELRGRAPMSRREREEILGYGPGGV